MASNMERTKYQGVYLRRSDTKRNPLDGKIDGCFYYSVKDAGGKKWIKVGWKSEGVTAQAAMQKRADHMQAIRHGEPFRPVIPELVDDSSPITFGRAWRLYREKWMPNFSNPIAEVGRYKIHIAPRFADRLMDDIRPLDLESFKQELRKKGLSPKSVKHILCLMRSVYNKMIEWELYDGRAPLSKFKMPKVDNARIRYLTPVEADQALSMLKAIHITWWRMASVSLNAGLRLGEIVDLIWGDLDLEAGVIHVRDAKAGTRMAYMNETLKAIFSGMELGKRSERVFSSLRSGVGCPKNVTKTFHRVVNQLGFNDNVRDSRQKVVFHTLRHTFASWLAIKGTPLYTIATLMGHSTLEMTKRYAHLCPDNHREAIKEIDGILNQPTNRLSAVSL
jgi:integrase